MSIKIGTDSRTFRLPSFKKATAVMTRRTAGDQVYINGREGPTNAGPKNVDVCLEAPVDELLLKSTVMRKVVKQEGNAQHTAMSPKGDSCMTLHADGVGAVDHRWVLAAEIQGVTVKMKD